MHSLIGAYVKECKVENFNEGVSIYPFKITYASKQVRIYYATLEEEREIWIKSIKSSIGYCSIEDFYEIEDISLGKGKFSEVMLAYNIKTKEKVAIKVNNKVIFIYIDCEEKRNVSWRCRILVKRDLST